ncbi:MAG: ATP-binding protein [Pseudomonadota bacterium]
MDQTADKARPSRPRAVQNVPRPATLFALAVAAFGIALFVEETTAHRIALGAATGLFALSVLVQWGRMRAREKAAMQRDAIARFVHHDAAPSFLTNDDGLVTHANHAAVEKFGDKPGASLVALLGGLFASPSAVLYRLHAKAAKSGSAREDVVMRRGHIRISVQVIGKEGFLWRLEEMIDRTPNTRGAEGVSLPMVTVSNSGALLFINEAMRRLIGGREKALDRIITDLPLRPGGVHELATIEGAARATVVEVKSAAGRRELYFLPVIEEAPSDWALIDLLPVPLLKIAPDGQVQQANRMARELLEMSPGEHPSLGALVEGLGRPILDWLSDAAGGRGLGRPEFVQAARPGKDVYLQITLERVGVGDATSLVAVLNDATELKTLEAQFVQSQKMQAIGQLAGGVAHDFNNLLTAIRGHCDLLLLRREPSDPDYADLEQINQNANRAASLVRQLLAFSRKQNLQPQIIDLRDSMADLTHLLNRLVGEKVELTMTHDPELACVRVDKRQLEQVLMNLVVNARDAMPDGGHIDIETRMETLDAAIERDRAMVPAGRYVVIRVADEGIGIPPDKLPKIFEPFFTTKRAGEGTGLGLSTAYGIIKQTGGYIFADSAVGQGTAFSIYLPGHDRPEDSPVRTVHLGDVDPPAVQGEGVVLLVEDEAPVRAFASRALRMRGYTVLEAANAEEALDALTDDALSVDVFVTDVVMPGMDGPSWVSKALETRPDTRVVFVSGYAEDHLADSQARIPNSVFLPKPFSLNELTATVYDQLQ